MSLLEDRSQKLEISMKKYWKSINEFENISKIKEGEAEFSVHDISEEEIKGKVTATRRDFLKIFGFSLGYAVMASSCETPIRKAIPYLIQPEEITPGIANYYTSTFYDGHDFCSILVKTREGRPIKIEGNVNSEISFGATNARVQASVLSLYDDARLKTPLKNGSPERWSVIDNEIISSLTDISKKSEKIVLLTSSIISPSTKQVIKDFSAKYPTTEVVTYDSISMSGIIEANKATFNKEYLPSYYFDKANIILSFNADFLGTWISPIEFTKQYSSRRIIDKNNLNLLKHIQFESTLSLTGSNADYRIPINPSQEGIILLNLYNKVAVKTGNTLVDVIESPVNIDSLADELLLNKGKSLIISSTNDVNIQIVVNKINEFLGNYNNTISLETPIYLKQAIDNKFEELLNNIENGSIKALLLYNVNPVYDYPDSEKIINAFSKLKLSVSFADTIDETAKISNYVCPDSNYLESWNDAEPKKNYFSFCQPVINKLFDTRQVQESLLIWCVVPETKSEKKEIIKDENIYYSFIKKFWEQNIFSKQKENVNFTEFWNKCLQTGVYKLNDTINESKKLTKEIVPELDIKNIATLITSEKFEGFEYSLYENVGIGTGKQANNPWLQELPDPVSKVCWDNYLAVSYNFAKQYNLKLGDNVLVNNLFELPVLIQPGQAENTVSIALGYGRTSAGKVADGIGKNAYQLIKIINTKRYSGNGIKLIPTGTNYIFALTQTHHSMEGREHIRETTLKEYKLNPSAGNEKHIEDAKEKTTLYNKREFKGHHWGLAIDLNLCTGCSACVIACQAENNVPVVGRDEVRNKRIMHWIRIDRYYSEHTDNPDVLFQPVMCQHCNNAPCENVCPVEATQNSKEGLNEMAYNRCIGTRYCMNNCPYRVRRFNWFEYSNNNKFNYNLNSEIGKMVLNPDVVVRTRGVVEKCSFCVQRIQEMKLKAKIENRELLDGEIKPACLQSCPASAMIFGDLNMPNSKISKTRTDERNYFLLEEINTSPAVGYLTKIKNKD